MKSHRVWTSMAEGVNIPTDHTSRPRNRYTKSISIGCGDQSLGQADEKLDSLIKQRARLPIVIIR